MTNNLEIVGSGASSKKIYKIDDEKLLIDFSLCNYEKYEIFTINKIYEDTELKRFITINKFLNKYQLKVPHIYQFDNEKMIIQNLGNDTLLNLGLNQSNHYIFQNALKAAIDWIIKLKKIVIESYEYIAQRIYGKIDMKLELEKFSDTALFSISKNDDNTFNQNVKYILDKIFDNSDKCIIHRDFQSGNLMLCNNELYVIDFQDMCIGIPYYDLVSLLYDLKISISDSDRNNLLQYYIQHNNENMNNDENIYEIIYLLASIRLTKSLTFRIKKYNQSNNGNNGNNNDHNNKDLLLEIKRGYNLLRSLQQKLKIYQNYHYNSFFNIIFQYSNPNSYNLETIILAAGKGTRMKSANQSPKVLKKFLNNYLLEYPIRIAKLIGSNHINLVVGYQADQVIKIIGHDFPIQYTYQNEQSGTGHAVQQVYLDGKNHDYIKENDVLVLMGDTLSLNYHIIDKFITKFRSIDQYNIRKYSAGILTHQIDIKKYPRVSRIVHDTNGNYLKSIEAKDLTPEYQEINETSCGVMIFQKDKLLDTLPLLKNDNKQNEYYLPDVINILAKQGHSILVHCDNNIPEIHGANTPEELAELENIYKKIDKF